MRQLEKRSKISQRVSFRNSFFVVLILMIVTLSSCGKETTNNTEPGKGISSAENNSSGSTVVHDENTSFSEQNNTKATDALEWVQDSTGAVRYEIPSWESVKETNSSYYYPFGKDNQLDKVLFYISYIDLSNELGSEGHGATNDEFTTIIGFFEDGLRESNGISNYTSTSSEFQGRPAIWNEFKSTEADSSVYNAHGFITMISDTSTVMTFYYVLDGAEDDYSEIFKRFVSSMRFAEENSQNVSETESTEKTEFGNESTNNSEEFVVIKEGETTQISNDVCEIEVTLNDIISSNLVTKSASDSGEAFLSFPDIPDESYICVVMTVKNVGANAVDYTIFKDINIICGGKYNYDMTQADVTYGAMDYYWQCDPLKSCDILFFRSVPDEALNMGCNISFYAGDTQCGFIDK